MKNERSRRGKRVLIKKRTGRYIAHEFGHVGIPDRLQYLEYVM